jgi:hypothetical protein
MRKQSARLDDYDESYDELDDDAYDEDDYSDSESEEDWDEEDEDEEDNDEDDEDCEKVPSRHYQKLRGSSKSHPSRKAATFARSIGIRESKRKKLPTSSIIRAVAHRPKPSVRSNRWRYHNAETSYERSKKFGKEKRGEETPHKPHFWNVFQSRSQEQDFNSNNRKHHNAKDAEVSNHEGESVAPQGGTLSAWVKFLFLLIVLAGGTWYAFYVSALPPSGNMTVPAAQKNDKSENTPKVSTHRIANRR